MKKENWSIEFEIENATRKQIEKIEDAFINILEKEGLKYAGGFSVCEYTIGCPVCYRDMTLGNKCESKYSYHYEFFCESCGAVVFFKKPKSRIDDTFIGKCRICGKDNVEIDLDFGGCVKCAKKYSKEQKERRKV